jgi:hypothetical protein
MIFIVSVCHVSSGFAAAAPLLIYTLQSYSREAEAPGSDLGLALNRVGHHIRQSIVEQARASLGELADMPQTQLDVPEPIPEDQEEINKQADAAIRDLFPRIPNTDRQTIIEHSFKKVRPPTFWIIRHQVN